MALVKRILQSSKLIWAIFGNDDSPEPPNWFMPNRKEFSNYRNFCKLKPRIYDAVQDVLGWNYNSTNGYIVFTRAGIAQVRVGSTVGSDAGFYFDAQDGDFTGSDYGSLRQLGSDKSVWLMTHGSQPLVLATNQTARIYIVYAVSTSYRFSSLVSVIVPDGSTYKVTVSRGAKILRWHELS